MVGRKVPSLRDFGDSGQWHDPCGKAGMKTPFLNLRASAASVAALALFAMAGPADAQTSGARGRFEVGPTDTPPTVEPSGPAATSSPNSAVGAARAVDIDPRTAQARSSNLPPVVQPPVSTLSVFEILSGSEDFTTFVTAVKAAGLDRTLKRQGPLTVFAPTNQAFAALPDGVVPNLLKQENREPLRRLLTYHVLPHRMTATQVIPGRFVTMQGEPAEFLADERGVVRIQGARIIQTDVMGQNGVIHAIDKVLVPKSVVIENFATPTANGAIGVSTAAGR
jgi:uncharacterized surface protein with fasciclin (FAS1) repeats